MNKIWVFLWVFAILAISYHEVHCMSVQSQKVPVGIVNGTNAQEGEFPYLVQVRDEQTNFICGGSIIGDKWILTAGHCVEDATPDSIIYGTNILYDRTEAPNNTIYIKRFYSHPKYIEVETAAGGIPIYDVGLLELAEPIVFNDKAKPIKLVDASEVVPFHVNGSIAGWGVNETFDPNGQLYLQKLQLQLLTDAECKKSIDDYGKADVFDPVHDLCSNDHLNGVCYGDSGGPFVINGTQYGIVSWSLKPCGRNSAAYSRLPHPEYRSFIKNITGI